MKEYIRLKDYAKKYNVTYRTVQNWWKDGKIPGAIKLPSGSIVIPKESNNIESKNKNLIYCRVSGQQKKEDLERQVKRCLDFCASSGIIVDKIIKEIASGMNDNRTQLNKYLYDNNYNIIIENKDRLTRFGFNYIKNFMKTNNRLLIIINSNNNEKEDLMQDLISIITSFCCRFYSNRRCKNKINKIKSELLND